MAIAFDAAGTLTIASSVDTITAPHTCTGANRFLRVGFLFIDPGLIGTIVTATYAGVAMTQVDTVNATLAEFLFTFELVNPASGTNNIEIVVYSAAGTLVTVSSSYAGAKQTGQPDAVGHDSATSPGPGPASTVITTVADNCWLTTVVRNTSQSASAGAGSTFRCGNDTIALYDGNGPVSPAGSAGLEVDFDGACIWAQSTASFSPFVGGGSNIKTVDGVAIASVKTIEGVAIASVKTLNGVTQ